MFRRIIDLNNFKQRMIFSAFFFILVLTKVKGQLVPEINMISCEFDTSFCGWKHFRETSEWKMSNSTMDRDIPENGRNFLLLRGASSTAKISMIKSRPFKVLPRKISLKQTIFCSGSPHLELHFSETTSNTLEFLTYVGCSKGKYWEEIEEHSEADPDDLEDAKISTDFHIILVGMVKYGDVIAIQDLRFKDETTESTSTSTQDSMKSEITTNTILTSETDLKSTTGTSFTYSEINSTRNSNFSRSSSLSTTEEYQKNNTIASLLPEYESTKEVTTGYLFTKITSAKEIIISPVTDASNYTDSVSDVSEGIYTENTTFTNPQDLKNHTEGSSVPLRTSISSSQSEDEDQKTTTSASTENSTSTGTTDSGKKSLLIQNDDFFWKTVFISTLTAISVYTLLSLLVIIIRQLMRTHRRK